MNNTSTVIAIDLGLTASAYELLQEALRDLAIKTANEFDNAKTLGATDTARARYKEVEQLRGLTRQAANNA
jgi:hypothetical protein